MRLSATGGVLPSRLGSIRALQVRVYRSTVLLAQILFLFVSAHVPAVAATTTYTAAANQAAQWLEGQQNPDGSWGSDDSVKLLYTSEAVAAFRALDSRSHAYFAGVAWLENHAAANSDYAARRIVDLSGHGDNVIADVAALSAARAVATGETGGWGVNASYNSSPIDTAVVLLASPELSTLGTQGIAGGLNYLTQTQLASGAWPVDYDVASADRTPDAFTTALAVRALAMELPTDSGLAQAISNGATWLQSNVTTASPAYVQAAATLALHDAGVSQSGLSDSLVSIQQATSQADGSLNEDVLATALAAHAWGDVMGLTISADAQLVDIPDDALRAAINAQLGRNAMDSIDRGEMLRLTTLNAANDGITNLTGLQYALNLTSADLSNNDITDTSPVASLTNTQFTFAGNPLTNGVVGDVNGDGKVDAADVLLVERYVLGLGTLTPDQMAAADIAPSGGDGVVNVSDLVVLQQLVLAAQ